MSKASKTTVGTIQQDVLQYTAGEDIALDMHLVEVDCIGSAAHAVMLSRMPGKARVFTVAERKKLLAALAGIIRLSRKGRFTITLEDQDVHLAVERHLTEKLGDLGRKIHTARSRNDQVALDLRLFAKQQLLGLTDEAGKLIEVLLDMARAHADVPMVGRTHMQPAMPSSIGLWASAYAEGLLEDMAGVMHAYTVNDQSPLGSAAGYGVPLPIDRQLVADLLGFSRPCHNVLYACNSRGKNESVILDALGQAMLTLSRLAQDLVVFTMPEFAYFTLPKAFCTGSSIMPQKNNPDVLEIMRAKASKVLSNADLVKRIVEKSLSGYNRDIQEAKAPFMEGIAITRASLRILAAMLEKTKVNRTALEAGFKEKGVFATDYALELVGRGMTFRDAYHHVKAHLDQLQSQDPYQVIAAKTHLGGTAGLDFGEYAGRLEAVREFVADETAFFEKAVSRLLGSPFKLG